MLKGDRKALIGRMPLGWPAARLGSHRWKVPLRRALKNETRPASASAWSVWISDFTYGGRVSASR
jgi:hypothetical protein